jgi:hypothetical protein
MRIALALISLFGTLLVVLLLDRDPARRPVAARLGGAVPQHTRSSAAAQDVVNAALSAVVLVPSNPRALDVVLEHSDRPGACSLLAPRVTVVSQDGDVVRLRASGQSHVPLSEGGAPIGGAPDALVMCAVHGYLAVRVELARPLGTRRLVDDGGRMIVPLDPAAYPRPTYLPTGFVAVASHRIDVAAGHLNALRRYQRGADVLEVQAGDAGSVLRPAMQPVGDVTLGNQQALLSADAGNRCVSWLEHSGQLREVCDYPAMLVPMARSQLLRIARSVH